MRFGRSGSLYIFMMLLNMSVAIYIQANLLFWTFGLMVGGAIVSLIIPLIMLFNLRISRALPSHGVAGESMPLGYHVANERRWIPAFGIIVSESWGRGADGWRHAGPIAEWPQRLAGAPHTWLMHVGATQNAYIEAPCWPLRRGTLHLEKIILATSFPFGIFQVIKECELPDQVLVYPHLYRINRRVIATLRDMDPRGRKQINQAGGNEEFYGLREYHEGDSIKTIDWRRTARTGEFVSKEMTQPSPPKVMVCLDLTNRPVDSDSPIDEDEDSADGPGVPRTLTERAISLAASVICEAYYRGHQVGMCVQGAPCMPFPVEHNTAHRIKMLESLARLDTSNQMTDPSPLPAPPSVVVRPGRGDSIRGTGGAISGTVVLGAAQVEEYVLKEQT